jgi:hypothetical protein
MRRSSDSSCGLRGRRIGAALLLILLCAPRAYAVYGDSDGAFGIDANFRTIGGVSINYDNLLLFPDGQDADAFMQAPLRIIAAGHPTEHDRYTLHVVEYFTASTYSRGGSTTDIPFGLAAGTSRYRALDLNWEQVSEPNTQLGMTIDRINYSRDQGKFSARIGRQAISLGHAFLWSPMDVFLPFDPQQFDQEYKPGVDAGRTTWSFGDFSGFEVIGVLGRQTDVRGEPLDPEDENAGVDWYGSAVLGNLYTNFSPFDLSIQGGKIYGGYQVAGGLTGDIRGFDLRAEFAYKFAEPDSIPATLAPIVLPGTPDLIEDRAEATIAIGRRFEPGVTLQLQYFYNGAGDPDDRWAALARVSALESFAISRNLIGFAAVWETTPLVTLSALMVVSADDGSLQLQPLLTYSVSDESEFIFGAGLNFGDRPDKTGLIPELKSEYGTYPHSIFFEFKLYF